MRYSIFSDIHGNLHSLEAVLHALESESIDQHYCVGDIVGYGAHPGECIRIVRKISQACIAGNHDWASVDKVNSSYFNPVARSAVLWAREHITEEDRKFLRNLELTYINDDFMLVHGMLPNPERFRYLSNAGQAREMFAAMMNDICFIGHSHRAGVFTEEKGRVSFSTSNQVLIQASGRYVVNVGSVGQPRDNDPRAAYCIYDSDKKIISIKRVAYAIGQAQQDIIRAGLPLYLAQRLAVGQ